MARDGSEFEPRRIANGFKFLIKTTSSDLVLFLVFLLVLFLVLFFDKGFSFAVLLAGFVQNPSAGV